MDHYLVFAIGFLAQMLFSARQITQWLASERAGRILSPLLFWQLSILASSLLVVYGFLRRDPVIILGQAITYGVYIRNLHYHGFWTKIPRPVRFLAFLFPGLSAFWLLAGGPDGLGALFANPDIPYPLMAWGFIGQGIFTFRFIYQWLYSERRRQSLLPIGFWIISITGSIIVLGYAVFRKDPVLLLGQLFGTVVYSRNIFLGLRQTHAAEDLGG